MLSTGIIRQIEALGYAVRTSRVGAGGEIFAVNLAKPTERHAVKMDDPDDPDERNRAASKLAAMVGIEVEG